MSGTVRMLGAVLFATTVALTAWAAAPSAPVPNFRTLEPGLELGAFPLARTGTDAAVLQVLRIDPERFDLKLASASATPDGRLRSARDWCRLKGFVAAINASMYQTDLKTSVGLMKTIDFVNNSHVTRDKAVLAFDPVDSSVPRLQIIDRELQDFEALRTRYRSLVQSIRMVSLAGKNMWVAPPDRKWSIAAIGMDRQGRPLFIHSREPLAVRDFVDQLLTLPIELRNAMYVEGGPEAQLSIESGAERREFVGSFETGFNENDTNMHAWPIPNVIGVARRSPRGPS